MLFRGVKGFHCMLHMILPGLADFVVSCRPRYAMYNPSLVLSKVGITELSCKVLRMLVPEAVGAISGRNVARP